VFFVLNRSFRSVMQASELLRFNFGQIDIRIGMNLSSFIVLRLALVLLFRSYS
jgi:hypothetical protein